MRSPLPIAIAGAAWLMLLAVVGLALPGSARAAAATSSCAAAWAIAGLDPGERERLADLCARAAAPAGDDRPLLTSLVSRASWEAAIVGELARGGAPHLDLGPDAPAAARLRALRDALRRALVERGVLAAPQRPDCKDIQQSFRDYLADRAAGEVPVPPVAAHALAGGGCLALDPAAVAEVHLVTVAADDVDALFVAAATAERVVLQWFTPAEALTVDGRRVFVVAVPRWAVVTVEAARGAAGPPARWHGFVTRDATVWDRPPEAGCLRLSAALDGETTLLLDGRLLSRGQPLARRTVGVGAGAHELVALRCAAGRCAAQFRETLAEQTRTSTRNLCQDLEIDLQQSGTVAVLGAGVAPGCDSAIGWQVGVLAADYLRKREAGGGRQFRDLKAFASLTESLADLKASLNPSAGQVVGARTGADGLEVLGTVAKEAWRQGIDELVTFELRCDASSGEYTLSGSVVAVRDVFTRERGLTGLDLQSLLRVEALRFRGAGQLTSAVASVLDRLLGREFIRFREGPAAVPYRETVQLELLAHSPAGKLHEGLPQISAHVIAEGRRPAPRVCSALARGEAGALEAAAARARQPAGRRVARVDIAGHEDQGDGNANAVRVRAGLRASRPGTYLLVARWPDAPLEDIADARCVRFDVPDGELWGALMYAPDLTIRSGVSEFQAAHVRAHLGYTWYQPRPWLGFGAYGGYSFSSMVDREGLPSWQDIAADPSESRGRFQWFRHVALVGPLIELRSRRATLPFELRARLSGAMGVAIVDVQRIPPAFAQFRTPARINATDLRLSPALDLLLELGVGYHLGPVAVTHTLLFGATAIHEMISPNNRATALDGRSLVLGIGLVLGGAP